MADCAIGTHLAMNRIHELMVKLFGKGRWAWWHLYSLDMPGYLLTRDQMAGVREQILILGLRGPDSLANRQIGGYFYHYDPFAEDIDMMASMVEQAVRNRPIFTTSTLHSKVDVMVQIREKLQAIPKLEENRQYLDVIMGQIGDTLLVNGVPVSVALDKDVTFESFRLGQPFYGPTSRAGNFAFTSYNKMEHCLRARCPWLPEWATAMIKPGGFWDLCKLPGMIEEEAMVNLFEEVMLGLVSPVLLRSRSRHVHSFCLSGFKHFHGLPAATNFLDEVGVPKLVEIHPDIVSAREYSVIFGVLHEGFPKYFLDIPDLRRFMFLTTMASTVFGLILAQTMAAQGVLSDRERIQLAIDEFNTLGYTTKYFVLLNQLKLSVQEEMASLARSRNRKTQADLQSGRRDIDATHATHVASGVAAFMDKMERIGRTIGAPSSDERRDQLQQMREDGYHEYNSAHPYFRENRQEFDARFLALRACVVIHAWCAYECQTIRIMQESNISEAEAKLLQSLRATPGYRQLDADLRNNPIALLNNQETVARLITEKVCSKCAGMIFFYQCHISNDL